MQAHRFCFLKTLYSLRNNQMVHGKMRTAIILLLMNLCCAFGRLTVEPQNAAVIAGERMSMECRMDEESRVRKWDLFDVNRETTTVYTHSGGIIHSNFLHFGVQVNGNGSGILYANSTKMEDAGKYTCIANRDNKDFKFSAQLIVFESEPKCETNFTRNDSESLSVGDFIWMRCSVVFRGFWTPTFEWRQHLENGETGMEGRTVTDGVVQFPSSNVTSTLSIAINPTTNGSYFSCKISFADYDDKGSSDTPATNLPDFNYTWESDVIHLPYSSVSFDATVSSADRTTLDVKPSVSADTQSVRENPSSDRYFALFMVVAGLSLFLVLIVIIAIAFCIHYKRKVSGKISTSSALDRTERQKRPSTMIYDIIPYAVTDNYETIDEMEMEDTTADEMKQRRATDDPHDSQGYSGLLATQPTPPAVYSRMDHCERPSNADHTIDPNANETNNSNANEERPEEPSEDITSRNVVESHPYLELSCDPSEKSLVDEKADACRNIKPTTNDALDVNVIDSRSSNNESPTSYNNFNYETPQLPLTVVQVSPTETSAYTNLLSRPTRELQQTNPDIPSADCATKGTRTLPKPPPRKL